MSQTSPATELSLERERGATDGDVALLSGLVGGVLSTVSLRGGDDDGGADVLQSRDGVIRLLLVADDDGEVCVTEVVDVNEADTVAVTLAHVTEEVAAVDVVAAEVVAEAFV